MTLDITVTDLFCGAGGSSLGAEAAGARLRMAANHWRLAIDTHNSNFPNADHDCADISQVNPRRYPSTDVLIASPECTNHSQAKSHKRPTTLWDPGDASEERSRATMWDVPRFAEFHRYKLVIVENVVEALRWEPYGYWLGAMQSLGYDYRQLFLNSLIAHPTPQSRDRLYVVFWRRGNPAPDLDIRPRAWCGSCEADVEAIQSWKRPDRPFGKYRAQYVYRCPTCAGVALPYAWPAAAAIDWSLPAPRIGDRARPLAEATLRRIKAGLDRYGANAIVQAAGHTYERPGYYRTWPTWEPLGTQMATAQHALVVDTAFAHAKDSTHVTDASWPVPTQTGQQSQALVVTMRGTDAAALDGSARSLNDPFGPQTTQRHDALVVSMREGDARRTLPAGAGPLGTVTAESITDALVVPLRTHGVAEPAEVSPVPTIVAGNAGHALLVRHFTPRGDAAQMTRPVSEPTGTITGADHHSLLIPYNRTGPAQPVDSPHRTMDTRDRYALVEGSVSVEDCGFRMLEPHEIGRAMAFPDSYNVLGNKRDRVRQYGNAVTPPIMSTILERAIGSLAGGRA
jgi:DNA (cytosine-5)-methyltransferase 1